MARQRLNGLARRLPGPAPRLLRERERQLRHLGQRLETASPLASLNRGYSITLHDGQALRSIEYVQPGDTLLTRLADGEIITRVEEVQAKPFDADPPEPGAD
jgi:exodeoxyribonuclease VII large subunit